MCKFRLNLCCWLTSLRTGALIIAILQIVIFAAFGILSFVVGSYGTGFLFLVLIAPSVILFVGARSEKFSPRGPIFIWLIVHGIVLVLLLLNLLSSLLAFIIALIDPQMFGEIDGLDFPLIFGVASAIYLVLCMIQAYMFLVVYSLYRQLKDKPRIAQVDPYPLHPEHMEEGQPPVVPITTWD